MSLWKDFKQFAFSKGNAFELAIAFVLGASFTNVVNSLAKNVLMPLVSYIIPANDAYKTWQIGRVEIGVFLGELLNFFITALILFFIVKWIFKIISNAIEKAEKTFIGSEEVKKEDAKKCPECCMSVPANAKKCPYCRSRLEITKDYSV